MVDVTTAATATAVHSLMDEGGPRGGVLTESIIVDWPITPAS